MQMYCFKRAGTVTKGVLIDKFLRGSIARTCVILSIFCANGVQAGVIPVTLTWFQPQGRTDKYMIEISDDVKFGTSVAKAEVAKNQFSWQALKEGTYHWRVTPVARLSPATSQTQTVETSSVASGSFIAVDAGPESADPVVVRWSDDPSVTAYHLKIQEDGRDARVIVSLLPTYTLFRSAKPFALQIVPRTRSSSNKIARDAVARFDPNLMIVVKAPEKPALPPPPRELVVGDQPIPKEEPHAIEALPPPPAAVEFTDKGPHEEVILPENRVMELMLAVYNGTEKTYSARGAVDTRRDRANVTGAMLSYRAIPFPGLHLQASGNAHSHFAKWRDANNYDAGTQNMSSYFGEAGIGWDVFFRNPNRRHQLVFDIRGAMASIYDLPFESADLLAPTLKRQDLQLWGGGAWYRWTAKKWGAGGHVASMVQTVNRTSTNDSGSDEWGAFVAVDPIPYLTISAGALSRLTVARRCPSDATICAANGASATRNSLVSGYLGIGYVVY